MKHIYFLAQVNPELNFITPNFDSYFAALTEHFLLVILLFLAIIAVAFVFYYAFGVLYLFLTQLMASPFHNEGSNAKVETTENVFQNV